jgi:1-acyl-sn-glycerol-3-phosphate acyltransferase
VETTEANLKTFFIKVMSVEKQSSGLGRDRALLSYWMGRLWLRLFGWKIHGEIPSYRKFVFIAAPHTSNWDLPFMLATAYVMRMRISWLGNHPMFTPPGAGFCANWEAFP